MEEQVEEVKPKRHYKVEVGDKLTIKRNDFGEHTFYKISLKKKNYDGTESWFDKNVAFPKGTDIANGTKIIVKDFFEDVYARPNDRYNANWTLFITEWEELEENAFAEYNKAMEEVSLNDDDLPF